MSITEYIIQPGSWFAFTPPIIVFGGKCTDRLVITDIEYLSWSIITGGNVFMRSYLKNSDEFFEVNWALNTFIHNLEVGRLIYQDTPSIII